MPGAYHRRVGRRSDMSGPSVDPPESGDRKGLTSIHRRIHCAATQKDECINAVSETDRIILEHFFDTLAEVAMAVAKRTIKEREQAG